MVVFKEAVPGTRDVGSGFASMPFSTYTNSGTGAITVWGATVTNDIPFLVLDVATGDVFYQDNPNEALNRLAFVDDDQAVNDFTFTLVSRILLSTDTDESTFQVNSSKVTREVTIFSNPVFKNTDEFPALTGSASTVKSVDVELDDAEFVQRALVLSDFIFDDDFNPPASAAVKVVRVDNITARIYGLSGLTAFSGIRVASKALVADEGGPHIETVTSGFQFAIATVAPKAIVITSGTTLGATSGVAFQFTVTLTNDTFKTSGLNVKAGSGLDDSGINLLTDTAVASGIRLTIGDDDILKIASGLSLRAINVTPSVAGSSSVTFQLRGTQQGTYSIPTTATELKITIGNLFLTKTTANVDVLTADEAVSLTASPKLTIRFDDLS
jgi:hypothetical protein